MASSMKLYYFNAPGRAETARIMLTYGGIPFEHITFGFPDWPQWKPKMPFGQVPVLEVDGKKLTQSAAIDRYVARLAGLLPEDPWASAKMDEVVVLSYEALNHLVPTFSIKDVDARTKARQELLTGPLKVTLDSLETCVAASDGEFLTGSKPTYGDFLAYTVLSSLFGGSMDGIPTSAIDVYPKLKALHNRAAALPTVAKMYEGATGDYIAGYKAFP